MGVYLGIKKIDETESSVTYQFDSGIKGCEDVGILEIDKKIGNCKILKEMPGDVNNILVDYSYRAVLKYWKKGEFPDVGYWAS